MEDVLLGIIGLALFSAFVLFAFWGIPAIQWMRRPKSGFRVQRAFPSNNGWFYVDVIDFGLREDYSLAFNHEPTELEIVSKAKERHEKELSLRNKRATFGAEFNGRVF